MKKEPSKLSWTVITFYLVTISALNFGCASHVIKKNALTITPITLSPMSNPSDEISVQHELMDKANSAQVDVLAPAHFDEAKKKLDQAELQNQKGASSIEILATLGYARAHLEKATQDARTAKNDLSEISSARWQAIDAGARKTLNRLATLDEKFKLYSQSHWKITAENKAVLKNEYLALELYSIKEEHLRPLKDILNQARAKGAVQITPKAYNHAMKTYNISETLIETDRHNEAKITSSINVAMTSAKRVMNLLSSEQNSRNQTPEQRAVILESRDLALKRADSAISDVAQESIQKDNEIAEQNKDLALSGQENKVLRKREYAENIVASAAAQFTNDEADVYRQDGTIIIRLKTMNFSSGRSDLPSESIAILTKVKEVIKYVGPSSIMIEGHTDGIGTSKINQSLSENRAKSVKEFFSSDKFLEKNDMSSKGFGYSKPLATNKTKEGRAQNRRVDIVIKPQQTI